MIAPRLLVTQLPIILQIWIAGNKEKTIQLKSNMYPFVNTYMLLVTILCSSFMVSHEMLLDPAVGKYIQDVLKEFSNNPTSNTFDNIINPKLCGNDKRVYFLPKIFIWCPITHYNLKLRCPEHNTVLEPGFWTNLVEMKSPRNPRLVYNYTEMLCWCKVSISAAMENISIYQLRRRF